MHQVRRVLITGAAGYIASQLLPAFRGAFELVLLDVTRADRQGRPVAGVELADLVDTDRGKYARHFEGVDAVVHLGYKTRRGEPLDHFFDEQDNVVMAYNVLRCAYEAGVPRVGIASSNHAADWYEHNLIHARKLEVLDPYKLPLSDNFYGWAKATYEHLGFLFACGALDPASGSGSDDHLQRGTRPGRRMGVVMVRIGAPREIEFSRYRGDLGTYKRDLGAYVSPRDLTQLFRKAIETPNIENEHGVPWQVVYGISGNTRAFWSLANARKVLGYQPEDDSEVKYAADIQRHLTGEGGAGGPGRVGVS